MRHLLRLFLILLLAFVVDGQSVYSQESAPVTSTADSVATEPVTPPPASAFGLAGEDMPNDNGHKLRVKWQYPAKAVGDITGFEIWRATSPSGEFRMLGQAPNDYFEYLDIGNKETSAPDFMANNSDFFYKVVAIGKNGLRTESEPGGPFRTYGQWFHRGKTPVLVGVVLFGCFTFYFIRAAKKGKELYVRPLAGIEAVDEAIGRATEMGKPTLYILGIGTASEIATIASFAILGRVAKKIAEYQTQLIVPCYDAIVMSIAQDVVRSSYLQAGRPDQYSDDMVYFVTNAQFAYVAGVNGIMMRQRPATNFYLGYFAAESLILAETGNSIGAIQIAGTDQITQIPFFVVACDYTLIGEELYAASAYLGRDPLLLGSLKAEDWGKGIVMALIVVGVVATIFGWDGFRELIRVNL